MFSIAATGPNINFSFCHSYKIDPFQYPTLHISYSPQTKTALPNICTFISYLQFLSPNTSLILKFHPFFKIQFKCHPFRKEFYDRPKTGSIPFFCIPKAHLFLPLPCMYIPFTLLNITAIYISELAFLPIE